MSGIRLPRSVTRNLGLALTMILLLGSIWPLSAFAIQISYPFSTTVQAVNTSAPGFPSTLAGVAVGDPISGVLSYESLSPTTVNNFSGTFGLATLYSLQSFSLALNVDGGALTSWSGIPSAFVWDNTLSGGGDGLLFTNLTGPSQMQFQLGTLNLPASAFSDTSLPSGDLTGAFVLSLGLGGNLNYWLQTNGINGLVMAPVPVPAAVWLFGSGVMGLLRVSRKRRC